jgi:hypothetical protein
VQDEFDDPNSNNLKNATIQDGNSIKYWGHEIFTRSTGKPEVVKNKIGCADLIHFEPEFVLHVKNGDGTNNLVSSAIVKLDGKQIFGPSDFSKKITSLTKGITGVTENSELEVEVRGTPNSFLDIWIEGNLLPGHALFSPDGGNFFFFDGTVQIILPSNAVKKPIYISIKNITEKLPPEYQTKISLAYEFLPDGLSFEKPLGLSIKIKNDIEIKPYSQIGLFDIKSGYVFYNETNIDIYNRVLSTEIEHFSTWAYWTWVNIPSFNENGLVKIPTGWLIEKCGWKGKRVGNVGVYEKQSLVLVNYGDASGEEIKNLCDQIIKDVYDKFGLQIQAEVNLF